MTRRGFEAVLLFMILAFPTLSSAASVRQVDSVQEPNDGSSPSNMLHLELSISNTPISVGDMARLSAVVTSEIDTTNATIAFSIPDGFAIAGGGSKVSVSLTSGLPYIHSVVISLTKSGRWMIEAFVTSAMAGGWFVDTAGANDIPDS